MRGIMTLTVGNCKLYVQMPHHIVLIMCCEADWNPGWVGCPIKNRDCVVFDFLEKTIPVMYLSYVKSTSQLLILLFALQRNVEERI